MLVGRLVWRKKRQMKQIQAQPLQPISLENPWDFGEVTTEVQITYEPAYSVSAGGSTDANTEPFTVTAGPATAPRRPAAYSVVVTTGTHAERERAEKDRRLSAEPQTLFDMAVPIPAPIETARDDVVDNAW